MPAETTPGGHRRFRLADIEGLDGAPSAQLPLNVRLISTGAAALILGVSQHTVIRACREGRLETDETTPGGHHRFSEKRIRALAPHGAHLVGTGGAARALGLSVDTLLRAVQHGAVTPAAVTPGGHRRFVSAELTADVVRLGAKRRQADSTIKDEASATA